MKSITAGLAILVLLLSTAGSAPAQPAASENAGVLLRNMMLSSKSAAVRGKQAVVIMDAHSHDGVASLMSSTEGDASMYFSSGGVLIGGGEHRSVRAAAIAFARAVSKHKEAMQKTEDFPYPATGNVRFYLRTRDGVFFIEVAESELVADAHALSATYRQAEKVIAEYQKVMASAK